MIRFKYPIEYELSPDILEKGTQWLTLRLKNAGDDSLHNLDIKMHSTNSLQISFRNPSDYIYRLQPDEEKFSSFQVDAHGTTALYFSIRYLRREVPSTGIRLGCGSKFWETWQNLKVYLCQILTVQMNNFHCISLLIGLGASGIFSYICVCYISQHSSND